MRFYVDGEFEIELFGVEAFDRCLECCHCVTSTTEEGKTIHRCVVNGDDWDFEKALEFEAEDLECWL